MLVDKPLVVFVPMSERATFRARLALLPAGGCIENWSLRFSTPAGTDIAVMAAVEARTGTTDGSDDELHWTLTAAHSNDADDVDSPVKDDRRDDEVARECAQLLHELKQPLSAIISYARGAIMRSRNRSLSPADLEGVLEIIVAEALRVAEHLQRRERESGGES